MLAKNKQKQKAGIKSAMSLTKEQRHVRATKAALIKAGYPSATHYGVIHIGNAEIPCAVLNDGRRVVAQRAMVKMLTGQNHGALDRYLKRKNIQDFLPAKFKNDDLSNTTIIYETEGRKAHGFLGEDIVDICRMYIEAKKAGALLPSQQHLADQAEIVVMSLAKVGITGLIDEATGYQEVRARDALHNLLDKYLKQEYAAWAKRFPDEFYKEIFRLKGWNYPASAYKNTKPQVIGKYTSNIVYDRIAPDLAHELSIKNPKNKAGNRSIKHHQWLTEDLGIPALQQHIHAVLGLMRVADNWEQFMKMLDRAFPVKSVDNFLLPEQS